MSLIMDEGLEAQRDLVGRNSDLGPSDSQTYFCQTLQLPNASVYPLNEFLKPVLPILSQMTADDLLKNK